MISARLRHHLGQSSKKTLTRTGIQFNAVTVCDSLDTSRWHSILTFLRSFSGLCHLYLSRGGFNVYCKYCINMYCTLICSAVLMVSNERHYLDRMGPQLSSKRGRNRHVSCQFVHWSSGLCHFCFSRVFSCTGSAGRSFGHWARDEEKGMVPANLCFDFLDCAIFATSGGWWDDADRRGVWAFEPWIVQYCIHGIRAEWKWLVWLFFMHWLRRMKLWPLSQRWRSRHVSCQLVHWFLGCPVHYCPGQRFAVAKWAGAWDWVLNCKVLWTTFKYIGVRDFMHRLCRIHLWLCSQRGRNRHCFCRLLLFEHAPSTEDCFHVWTWQDGSSAMETEGHDKVRFVVICNALVDCAIYLWFFLGFSWYDFCKAKTSPGPVFQENLDKDWHSVQCCYRVRQFGYV